MSAAEPARAEPAPIWDAPDEDDDPRNTRTFFRAGLLRQMRVYIRDNGPLAAMLAVAFVNQAGSAVLMPLIPFFASSLNAEPWQVTLMFSSFYLGQFFGEPYFGRLSDRIGRKPILILTTALSVPLYVALAFAPNIWVAIAIRFVGGLSSGNISTIQSYVSDVSRPDQRASRMSLVGAAFALGIVVGPIIGGLLSREHIPGGEFRPPLFAAAILSALACATVMLYLRESRQRTQTSAPPPILHNLKDALRSPVTLRVILSTLCYMATFASLEATFSLWVKVRFGWSVMKTATIFPIIGATAVIMLLVVMRPLVRRWGESKVLACGLFLFGLSFALQSLHNVEALIAPIVVLGTIGQSVIFPTICAIISITTPSDRLGGMLGLNMSTSAIARITGPIIAGALFSTIGPNAPLWMGAALTIPAALLALQVGRLRKAQ
ncbi:multidrug transporter [Asticcacaulis sp. AC460]|uniref:MFS transporter n=1 Tax=Asticcacaulis sp. AC460 TaxID=1282360 RepID=UPI0003C3E4A2|nr:MFS transporter [Asticcacaulis sp. AC460]ESQ87358.1 multidrug transporter [Asticcacaulis sp. AC460]